MLFSKLAIPSDYALQKTVINKCFSEYGLEDDIKACIAKYDGKRELMDPDLSGYHTLSNTHSMYHQPSSTWIVVGSD